MGNTGLELVGKGGSYITGTFGDAFKILSGMTTLEMSLQGYKHWLSVVDRVSEIHRQRGIEGKAIPLPPKYALPIIQAASLEAGKTLQGLWARLIANATDPAYAEKIHPAYIEILRQLSSDEAVIFQNMRNIPKYPRLFFNHQVSKPFDKTVTYEPFCESLALRYPERSRAYLDNLLRLKILEAESSFGKMALGWIQATAFGQDFIAACIR